jgi:predicted transcriptional regulator
LRDVVEAGRGGGAVVVSFEAFVQPLSITDDGGVITGVAGVACSMCRRPTCIERAWNQRRGGKLVWIILRDT